MAMFCQSKVLAMAAFLFGTVAGLSLVQQNEQQAFLQVGQKSVRQPASTGDVDLVAWNDRGLAPDQNDAPVLGPDAGRNYVDWQLCSGTVHSNLAGLGPDSGEQSIRYPNVDLVGGGQSIDLVVTANSSYFSSNIGMNGLVSGDSCFGLVNVKSKKAVDLLFSFYFAGTNTSVALNSFYFTVYDLDTSNNAVEVYTIYQSVNQVYVAPNHSLDITGNLSSGLTVRFAATEFGTGADNPKDPLNLTPEQAQRAVTVDFIDKSQWKVTFGVEGGKGGRNFVFAGRSSVVVETTTTTTTCADPQTCLIFADPHVSGFDNTENQGPAYFALYADRAGHSANSSVRAHTFDQRPVDVDAYDTGDFWLVKNEQVHIQGRFRYSGEFEPDQAAIGAVAVGGPFIHGSKLIVEPLDGTVSFDGFLMADGDWKNEAGDVNVHQEDDAVEVHLPMQVRLVFKRFAKHIDVQITMPKLPGGMDGECGNYDGIAENDEEDSVKERMGDLRVAESMRLFNTRFGSSAFRNGFPIVVLPIALAWLILL